MIIKRQLNNKNMETKFKIGDRVRNITNMWDSSVCIHSHNYRDIGLTGVIIEIGGAMTSEAKHAYRVKWDNGLECGKNDNQLELVQQENQSTTNNNAMKYFKTKEILNRSILNIA